jgi:hypothetical protein
MRIIFGWSVDFKCTGTSAITIEPNGNIGNKSKLIGSVDSCHNWYGVLALLIIGKRFDFIIASLFTRAQYLSER